MYIPFSVDGSFISLPSAHGAPRAHFTQKDRVFKTRNSGSPQVTAHIHMLDGRRKKTQTAREVSTQGA